MATPVVRKLVLWPGQQTARVRHDLESSAVVATVYVWRWRLRSKYRWENAWCDLVFESPNSLRVLVPRRWRFRRLCVTVVRA